MTGPPAYPTSPCKGCLAPLVWAYNAKTGDKLAVDPEPVDGNSGGGDVKLQLAGGRIVATVEKNPGKRFGWRHVYRRHMTTCPRADLFRTHQ
jgi:hypothetical protein